MDSGQGLNLINQSILGVSEKTFLGDARQIGSELFAEFASGFLYIFGQVVSMTAKTPNFMNLAASRYCLVPRRLSFDENVRAKEGGKETAG